MAEAKLEPANPKTLQGLKISEPYKMRGKKSFSSTTTGMPGFDECGDSSIGTRKNISSGVVLTAPELFR
uniref:Uncharacterized protein n=1 Tax=Ditylenchus dipsaci TaxID=166011 RepID=A0A915CRW8_9BILA